jgi:histone deacetylase 6
VRPPGHHCFKVPAGFCIANNIALAALDAVSAGKRVAIVDWDYHFGDGTAQRFLEIPAVGFVSLHCMRDSTGGMTYPQYHPLKMDALARYTGGRMFNICWGSDDAEDAAYCYAFAHCVLPALERFRPDVIMVSAGYDAIAGDALAGMRLTPQVFYWLTLGLKSIGVPVVCVLEGGYDLALLGAGVVETVRALVAPPDTPHELATRGANASVTHTAVVDRVREYIGL